MGFPFALSMLSTLLIAAVQAGAEPPADATIPTQAPATLGTVLVHGSQPGPGMWRVSKGGHELWILGTLRPLPTGMTWQSREVEAAIANSQEVLGAGLASADVGFGTMFKIATLMPSVLRTQHNPGGARLESVLPPDLYARWATARDRYLHSSRKLEDLRPVYASQQLYWGAVEFEGMSTVGLVERVVAESAKRNGVPITDTGFRFPLDLDRKQLKARIDEVNRTSGADIACFTATVDRLDAELSAMKVRANAWAVGDVGALRGLSRVDFQPPCKAVDDATLAFLGADALTQRLRATWLAAAERSLEKNESTFAYLPIADLLDAAGVLGDLRLKGFQVDAPDDEPADEP